VASPPINGTIDSGEEPMKVFFDLGLISSGACRNHFAELFHHGIRLPRTLVNEFLVEIGEAPIPGIDGA
jgi:hypothetical protein